MNEVTLAKLRDATPSIEKFRELCPEEQKWLYPLLTQSTCTALDILEAITHQHLSYEEIAAEVGIHPTSAKQILGALMDGGCSIDLREKGAFAPIGRSRNLVRKS
jgi:hypothetical protein